MPWLTSLTIGMTVADLAVNKLLATAITNSDELSHRSAARYGACLVFTPPALVGEIAFQNKPVVHAILFRAAAETLVTITPDPRHLGAKLA